MSAYTEVFAVAAIIAGALGTSVFASSSKSVPAAFDYEVASPAERADYLSATAIELKDTFKPNYIAYEGDHSVGGRSLSLSYDLRMSKLTCDTDETCKVMQCRRYLGNAVSKQNISVKLHYYNAKGQRIGWQLLKNSSCRSIVQNWESR